MEYRMEHRCEPRITLRLPVDAWHASGFAGRFYTHDLSSSGLGLCGAGAAGLEGRYLRLRVKTLFGHCTLDGMVLNADGERAGVMLANRAPALWRRLLNAPETLPNVA